MIRQTSEAFPHPWIIGTVRTFGLFGPAYQVLGASWVEENDDYMLHIKVLESGEEAEYPLLQALNDPEVSSSP